MLTYASENGHEHDRLARSVIDWWQLAGVEWDYADTPNDWLAGDSEPARAAPTATPAVSPAAPGANAPQTRIAPAADKPAAPPVTLPDDLAEFQRLWRTGELGGDTGSGPYIGPSGPVGARIMVMTGSPEPDDSENVLTGQVGRLLDNMLSACAVTRDQVYCASLFPRVVLDWRAAAEQMALWRRVALHHIGLVQPQALVVAGEDTVRALMGNDLSQNPPVLHFFNHGHGSIRTVVTRKLNLMLHRSAEEKRLAWQNWQLLLLE